MREKLKLVGYPTPVELKKLSKADPAQAKRMKAWRKKYGKVLERNSISAVKRAIARVKKEGLG